jgi:thermitase
MQGFILEGIRVRDEPGPLPAEPTHATSMALDFLNSYAFATDQQKNDAFGKVRLLPIDIYGSGTSTTTFDMAQGIHKAIQSNVNWINLPHGGPGESPMVDYLLEQAFNKGIMVSAAAGNQPTTDPTYPAANPYAIAVTAVDSRGNIAPYANRGSFVDVKAPGTMKVHYNGQSYYSTGTSTATSFVSGQAAALMVQGQTAQEAAATILKNFSVSAGVTRAVR